MQDKLKASKSRKDTDFLDTVVTSVTRHLHEPDFDPGVQERELGLSKTQLFRKLKQLTGYSAANYIRHIRLVKAAELVESTSLPIREVAERVGFNELSYFSSSFMNNFQATPTQWRKNKKRNNG